MGSTMTDTSRERFQLGLDEWARMVEQMQMAGTRQGDRVLIDAPDDSHAKQVNGQEGRVVAFVGGWVHIYLPLEEATLRFRADEVKVL